MPAAGFARVHGVAGAVERADPDAVRVEPGAEVAPRRRAFEQAVELDVRRRRPVAAAEFQHVHLEARGDREHRVEVGFGQAVGDHSDFHGALERVGERAAVGGGQAKPYHIARSAASWHARAADPVAARGIGYIARQMSCTAREEEGR